MKRSLRIGAWLSLALHLAGLAWIGMVSALPPRLHSDTLATNVQRHSAIVSTFIVARVQEPTHAQSIRPSPARPIHKAPADQPTQVQTPSSAAALSTEAVAAPAQAPPSLASLPAPPPQTMPDAGWEAASLPPDHHHCSASHTARLYPALLRERGLQGLVTLRVQVDEQGRAADIQLKQGSGLRLFDEAARLVAQACRFVPARRGEQTVSSWVEYPVRFALQ